MLNRRTFICVASAVVGPGRVASETAPGQIARIGFLGYSARSASSSQFEAFLTGLRELGWIEGKTAVIEYRSVEGHTERLATLVTDLVRSKVDVIMLSGSIGIRAAQAVNSTVPVVFVVLVDPVNMGFVSSLARPGGNMTGLASQFELLITKQLQLLREALPGLSRIALLNYHEATAVTLRAAEAAARNLGLHVLTLDVTDTTEFDGAFRKARSEQVGALQVLPSPYFDAVHMQLIELAALYRLPAFYEFRNYVRDGGLMSYGPSIDAMFHRAASYVDRILRGAKAGDLPIERPPKFELVVNLKTAAALGLTFPQALLLQVDEAIS